MTGRMGWPFTGARAPCLPTAWALKFTPSLEGKRTRGGVTSPAARGKAFAANGSPSPVTTQPALHLKNFIECVRTRQKPAADVEIGHRSTIVPHLGNIAFRTGHKIRWDAEREEIVDDPKASELLDRPARKPWDLI